MTELFRSSLFGYDKKSVSVYIAQMNEETSKRMMEKELEYKNRMQELQKELELLRQENEELRNGREAVANALIDAKSFAAELKEQTEQENREMLEKNKRQHAVELERIQAFAGTLENLQGAFRTALSSMEAELERYQSKCQAMQAKFEKCSLSSSGEAAEGEKQE